MEFCEHTHELSEPSTERGKHVRVVGRGLLKTHYTCLCEMVSASACRQQLNISTSDDTIFHSMKETTVLVEHFDIHMQYTTGTTNSVFDIEKNDLRYLVPNVLCLDDIFAIDDNICSVAFP